MKRTIVFPGLSAGAALAGALALAESANDVIGGYAGPSKSERQREAERRAAKAADDKAYQPLIESRQVRRARERKAKRALSQDPSHEASRP